MEYPDDLEEKTLYALASGDGNHLGRTRLLDEVYRERFRAIRRKPLQTSWIGPPARPLH